MLAESAREAAFALPDRLKRELRLLDCEMIGGQPGWGEFGPMDPPKYIAETDVVVIPEDPEELVEFLNRRVGMRQVGIKWVVGGDYIVSMTYRTPPTRRSQTATATGRGDSIYGAMLDCARVLWPLAVGA